MEKDIKGYEDIYSINEYGEVKNKKTGRILKSWIHSCGYREISLTKDKKRKSLLIHRLVAENFMEDFYPDLQVNHIDGDRQNNHVSNLEMCTNKENAQHGNKRRKGKRVSKKSIVKLFRSRKNWEVEDFLREIIKL